MNYSKLRKNRTLLSIWKWWIYEPIANFTYDHIRWLYDDVQELKNLGVSDYLCIGHIPTSIKKLIETNLTVLCELTQFDSVRRLRDYIYNDWGVKLLHSSPISVLVRTRGKYQRYIKFRSLIPGHVKLTSTIYGEGKNLFVNNLFGDQKLVEKRETLYRGWMITRKQFIKVTKLYLQECSKYEEENEQD